MNGPIKNGTLETLVSRRGFVQGAAQAQLIHPAQPGAEQPGDEQAAEEREEEDHAAAVLSGRSD